MIFVGYAAQHEGDCWRMYNPMTRHITQTRDVIWLNRMYYKTLNSSETLEDPIVALEVIKPNLSEDSSDSKEELEVVPASKHGEMERPHWIPQASTVTVPVTQRHLKIQVMKTLILIL